MRWVDWVGVIEVSMCFELEFIYQIVLIGLVVLDIDLCFLCINEWMVEMNGLFVEVYLGCSVCELLFDFVDQVEVLLCCVLEFGCFICDLEVSGEIFVWFGVVCIWCEQIMLLCDEIGVIMWFSIVVEEIIEQQCVEEVLCYSWQMLEFVMDVVGQVMWEWDVVCDYMCFIGNWEQVFGYEFEYVVNMCDGWLLLVMVLDCDCVDVCLDVFLYGWVLGYDCEYCIWYVSGSWVWIMVQGKVVDQDDQGCLLCMIGVVRDVMIEYQGCEELQQFVQLLQLVFDGIFVWMLVGGIEFWNYGVELQYGYIVVEVLGWQFNELFRIEFFCDEVLKEEVLQKDGLWCGEFFYIIWDGWCIVVNVVLQCVVDGQEWVLEIICDIIEVKVYEICLLECEQVLVYLQQCLQVVLDVGCMGVWDWVFGLFEVFWSLEVYKMFGVVVDVIFEIFRFLDLVYLDDCLCLDVEIVCVFNSGGDYEVEFCVCCFDGQVCWLVSCGCVMYDVGGGCLCMVGVNFDIIECKWIEEVLQEVDVCCMEFLVMLVYELCNFLVFIINVVYLFEWVGVDGEWCEMVLQIL